MVFRFGGDYQSAKLNNEESINIAASSVVGAVPVPTRSAFYP